MLKNKEKLNKLSINPSSELYKYYITYGGFDNDNDKFDEVFDIDELYENNIENNYWEDEYPNIREKYLQLSNIEGEGSYFYSLQDDFVYDVSWNEMDKLINGDLSPKWKTFSEFENDVNGETKG